MKKTNVRVDNFFIVEENGKHYLTEINNPEEWKDIDCTSLKIKKIDITENIESLLKKNKIKSNVNFIGFFPQEDTGS